MQKFAVFVFSLLLLAACNKISNNAVPSDNVENSNYVEHVKETNISTEEATSIATALVNQTLQIFDQVYYDIPYDVSNDELLQQLQKVAPYATEDFIEQHLFYESYMCSDGYCPSPDYVLMAFQYGMREQVNIVDELHFQISYVYPSFRLTEYEIMAERTNDFIQSYRQTLDIVYVDDTWKLDDLMNIEEDMNLQENEVEAYVNALHYQFSSLLETKQKMVIDQEEIVYKFADIDPNYTFEIVARTGFISSSAGLDYSPLDDAYLEDDFDYDNEVIDKSYLHYFENMELYKDDIDLSSEEVQTILNTIESLDIEWPIPPYDESRRDHITWLYGGYTNAVYSTYLYLTEKYTNDDSINRIDNYFNSHSYLRDSYFEPKNINYFSITDESVDAIMDAIWIERNFIFDLLVNEHNFE